MYSTAATAAAFFDAFSVEHLLLLDLWGQKLLLRINSETSTGKLALAF